MQRLLIVEDNSQFAESLSISVSDSFHVEVCNSAQVAIRLLHSKPFDVLLCDYVLGVSNGLEIVEHAKVLAAPPRVIMMTAFAETDMAIKALNMGVSHLLQKPFSVQDLRAVLQGKKKAEVDQKKQTQFCPVTNTVTWNGESVRLTPSEYLIFSYLISKKGKWISREQLEELLWNDNPHVSRNILDTHMYNLRKKVPVLNEKLSVIRGKGFLLNSLE